MRDTIDYKSTCDSLRADIRTLERKLAIADHAFAKLRARVPAIEAALVWANQNGYFQAHKAATEYALQTGTVWEVKQSYYRGFRDRDEAPSLEARLAKDSATQGGAI